MKFEQTRWDPKKGWLPNPPGNEGIAANLVLVFGATSLLYDQKEADTISQAYPNAHIINCSTAGEICDTEVFDDSLVVTAIEFEHTTLKTNKINLSEVDGSSYKAGEQLANRLDKTELTHVLVISDGSHVNGSELVKGLTDHLPKNVALTGGLAGDGPRFERTAVSLNEPPVEGNIVVVGFYGSRLKIGYGSMGGWDPFGPERLVTKSEANVLYELDDQSALALYKEYLGHHAAELPASGLLFPLNLRTHHQEGDGVVRTLLAIDEEAQSLTFAGDVPKGSYVRLMKANFDRLVDGALGAAETSYKAIGEEEPELAILISCVGRKLVLRQRVEDELESVRDTLGDNTILTGFYSYGEICPANPSAGCELHNQTMTITTFSEK